MASTVTLSRRSLLKGGAASVGGLVLGFRVGGALAQAQQAAPKVPPPNAWLRIAPDGTTTVVSNTTELGQGTMSAIPQILADELDLPWEQVRVEMGELVMALSHPMFIGLLPGVVGMGTGGSAGVAGQFDYIRRIGAAAREMLVAEAARRWGVPAAECAVADGRVLHGTSGRAAGYGELAEAAMALPVPADPKPKPKEQWRYIGKPVPRLDLPAKVDGSAVYGVDVKVPGMLVATLMHCPVPGGRLVAVDEAPAMAVKGVKAVVRLPAAVAVVAAGYWQARQGLERLSPDWDLGPNAKLDQGTIARTLAEGLDRAAVPAEITGNAAPKFRGAARVVQATYGVPYVAHACMEPMNATVHVRDDGVEVWAPVQAPGLIPRDLAKLLGVPADKVAVHTTFCGGGFGRRALADYVEQAALVSRAVKAPVKLVWSREEDIRHDFHRPAAACRMALALDAAGKPLAFAARVSCPSLSKALPSPPALPMKDGLDRLGVQGLTPTAYDLGDREVLYHAADIGIRIGPWRSVGHSHNSFFLECFIDEAAAAAGVDPVEFRRRLLAARPRYLKVLETAAAAAGWGGALPPGRFRGIAIADSFRTIVAQVAEVSVTGSRVRVHRVTCAVDCGLAVAPDSVRAQMEGSVMWGLGAALHGEITIEGGRVREGNFDGYRVLRMAEAPAVDVHIVDSGERMGGIGEPGVPPVAPAVANAVSLAVGRRIRSLPLAKEGFVFA
ncbi:MAG TPA: molybdopterin cofactor-binding domain-containing protein [Azospirillaceae bacterium]|nr:molybdopterin cofactor-binding domain-containing protein [Azospirillaceae bacterium]